MVGLVAFAAPTYKTVSYSEDLTLSYASRRKSTKGTKHTVLPFWSRGESSRNAVDLLVTGRWLRPGERDDVLAILLALRTVGFAPTVTRIA